MKWSRRFPHSSNNFDLCLTDSQAVGTEPLKTLLESVLAEKHRGLTLSSRAAQEFRRWFDAPDTPLGSEAYVLLSNWFTTQSGDRQSMVANRCENLWDALFPCRPPGRLSSPEPGRNHVVVPSEFERWWRGIADGLAEPEDARKAAPNDGGAERLRAKFDRQGLHFEVEGPPKALAEFMQMISDRESKAGGKR